ncbi:MAG: glycosyltransferase family 2 protein [Phycisphaerae bacterium]
MASAPKFSAIIATYNRKDYLLQAIQSVAEQTYPAHEITVVVDGSTDGSADAVRRCFPSVRVIEQPNLGRSIARNTGVAAATGDWICFLDDDDLWHREKLAKTMKYLAANPDCGAVNTWFWCFSDTATLRGGAPAAADFSASDLAGCHACAREARPRGRDLGYLDIRGKSYRMLLERNCGALSYSVIRRDVFIRAGGLPPAQAADEDRILFLNVARLCEWHTIPERLGFSRQHDTQDMRVGASALKILNGLASVWYGGRPLPHAANSAEIFRELASCAPEYKRLVQRCIWGAVRSGDLRAAQAVRKFGWLLLPRFRDRVYAILPPQITWRFERHVLGMHK